MGKFSQYVGDLEITMPSANEKLTIKWSVRDRIRLASIQSKKGEDSFEEVYKFLNDLISRSYPSESKEDIDAFLGLHFDEFIMELMVAAKIAKREDLQKAIDNAVSKKNQ